MPKSIIPLCEMVFDDNFSYKVSYFGIDEVLEGDEVPAYLAGILYGPNAKKPLGQAHRKSCYFIR
jgi:hypothetical protein